MTQNEKIMLRDLCMRLLYGVYAETVNELGDTNIVWICSENINLATSGWYKECKPYLRPMSSMTDEESNELESITFPLMEKDWDGNENPTCIRWIDIPKYMDFILSHHFDYRGLIEKGLAIEAPEGMYKKEE